jgi:alpha-L-fucosidase
VKAAGLHSGLYHSMFEWLNPLFLADQAANFTTRTFPPKTISELKDLVLRYEPDVLWSDGAWSADDSYWQAPSEFLQWLVNDSPVKDTVVFNDRWGKGDDCKHGSFFSCADRYNPGKLQPHKWENAMTLDYHSWGYRRNAAAADYMPLSELLSQLISTIAFGGNILINVGPAADGSIPAIMEERLLALGAWLAVNGEGVYDTTAWRAQNASSVQAYFVCKGATVFVHLLAWPAGGTLALPQPVASAAMSAQLLVQGGSLPVQVQGSAGSAGISLQLPAYAPNLAGTGSDVAWVVRLQGVA